MIAIKKTTIASIEKHTNLLWDSPNFHIVTNIKNESMKLIIPITPSPINIGVNP